jgi:hypothetical protein
MIRDSEFAKHFNVQQFQATKIETKRGTKKEPCCVWVDAFALFFAHPKVVFASNIFIQIATAFLFSFVMTSR